MWKIIISIMFHPVAARFVKKVATDFFAEPKKVLPDIENWVTMKI